MTRRAAPPPTRAQSRDLLTLDQAGELIGVSARTIRRRIADGSLASYRRKPGLLRVLGADVLALYECQPARRRRGRAA
ncbi:MAG: helix-turn-helix domain-containing protein [Bifidobacteriaceae bacterium]|nr:helix-turn-helix domain-containing protein [Bifidobacteriaceae bacterium]